MKRVRVAYTYPAAGNAPMALGLTVGLFAERGIDLEMIRLSRGSDAIRALEDGAADLSVVSGLPVLRAAERGVDPAVVMSVEAENVFAIIGREGTESIADLRGTTVGMNSPDDQDGVMMRRALTEAGLDAENDVTMVAYPGGRGAIWDALVRGEVSAMACTLPEPFSARVLGLPILRDFLHDSEPYQCGSFVVKHSYLADNADLLRETLSAQLASIRRFNSDDVLARQALEQCTTIQDDRVFEQTRRAFGEAMLDYVPRLGPFENVLRDVRNVTGHDMDVDLMRIVQPALAESL